MDEVMEMSPLADVTGPELFAHWVRLQVPGWHILSNMCSYIANRLLYELSEYIDLVQKNAIISLMVIGHVETTMHLLHIAEIA